MKPDKRGAKLECPAGAGVVPTAKRGGRPAAPPELKTSPFSLRLTQAEHVLVKQAANRRGEQRRCPAAWARNVLVKAALAETREPDDGTMGTEPSVRFGAGSADPEAPRSADVQRQR
jgi:hypothetical protein